MREQRRSTKDKRKAEERLIALLTDFGDRDHYVGTVKGVILSINPRARIVDISHNVSPQNIEQAGYLLWASYRYFPEETIFVCVVDPGVGSGRRIVAVNTDRRTFIAPDNGLLDLVLSQEEIRRSYEILRSPRPGSRPVSATFHGRDIFAPLAAQLSLGKSLSGFGRVCKLNNPVPRFYEPGRDTSARILHIDHFGNLVTNIPAQYSGRCSLDVGGKRISTWIQSYSEAPLHRSCMIVGSSGLIEIVLKDGSAAKALGADLGTSIAVCQVDPSLKS